MGIPNPRRKEDGKKEDDFPHHTTYDDEVTGLLIAVPSLPTADSDIFSTFETKTKMTKHTWFPSPFHPPPPWSQTRKEIETPISTSSVSFPAYSDQAQSIRPPTTLIQTIPYPPVYTTLQGQSDDGGDGDPSTWDQERGPGHKVVPAVAGAASVVMAAIIGFFIFFCLRKRKLQRQHQSSQAQMQEIKARVQPSVQSHVGASPIYAQYATPPGHPPPAIVAAPPPVILGPIVPGSNGAYYTGIDTSDVVSMHERTGLGNPFADGDSLNEEPPPPYRPRSLAPMSRNTSLRTPLADTSRTNLIGGHDQYVLSPFADPQEFDAMSDISGPTLQGNHDRMSVVSDMSYQEDPIVVRPAV